MNRVHALRTREDDLAVRSFRGLLLLTRHPSSFSPRCHDLVKTLAPQVVYSFADAPERAKELESASAVESVSPQDDLRGREFWSRGRPLLIIR